MKGGEYTMNNEITTPEVLVTTNYNQFKKLEGNRPFNKGLIVALLESIQNDGNYLQYNPIIVNDKMEVIDGQHRLKVAEDLSLPIYYIVAKGLKLNETRVLNSQKRNWTSADYLNAFIIQGDRDAMELRDFMKEYKFTIAIAVRILSGSESADKMKDFRAGKFEIKDMDWAHEVASLLSLIRDYSPDYAHGHTACLRAVMRLHDELKDPKRFERKLKQYNAIITRRPSTKDYLKQFESILNAGESKQISLSV